MKPLLIHIPKTGGRTLEHADLIIHPHGRILDSVYRKQLFKHAKRIGHSPQEGHCRLRDIDKEFLKSVDQVVAIVRNPWSRLVSQYMFAQKIFTENSMKGESRHLVTKDVNFETFLGWRHGVKKAFNWHRTTINFHGQMNYVVDGDKNLQCDILRFEHYDQDTMKYFNLEEPLEPRNVSNINNIDYREFYNYRTRKIVSNWFRDDIEFFGFTFDGPATKNIWNTDESVCYNTKE